ARGARRGGRRAGAGDAGGQQGRCRGRGDPAPAQTHLAGRDLRVGPHRLRPRRPTGGDRAAAAQARRGDRRGASVRPWRSGGAGSDLVISPSTPGKAVCTVSDQTLTELSGLIATKTGFISVLNGTQGLNNLKVAFLDKKCKVTSTFTNSAKPRDPQDMALGS